MTGGFIALHRKLFENPIWTSCPPATLRVWLACLCLANWKPAKWFDGAEEIEIPRGSFVTSRKKLSKFCGISEQQSRDSLDVLKRLRCVTSKGTSKYTVITVLNYSTYQIEQSPEEPSEEPAKEPSKNQVRTSEEPAENQRRTTIEESNKEIREQNTHTATSAARRNGNARAATALDLNGRVSDRFDDWFAGWSSVRGNGYRVQAASQYNAYVLVELERDLVECTNSYLLGPGSDPARGYRPDNFIREMYQDGFKTRWPAIKRERRGYQPETETIPAVQLSPKEQAEHLENLKAMAKSQDPSARQFAENELRAMEANA